MCGEIANFIRKFSCEAGDRLARIVVNWFRQAGMASPRASMRAIVLLVTVLTLAVAAPCSPAHPQRVVSSSLQQAFARTRHALGIHQLQRFVDLRHIFRRRSVKDCKQFGRREGEGNSKTTPKWRIDKGTALGGGLTGVEFSNKGGARLSVHQQELGRGATPVARPWPEEFTINFTTKSGEATGFLAYDWAKKRQIVYHGSNSTYCDSYGTKDACQMLEFPGGTYVYIPSLKKCFMSVEGVGSLPPEWTTNSEYVGTEEVPGVGLCRSFAFPPTAHVWYETVVGGLPCLFVFPQPTMSFYFDPDTFEVGIPNEKYFDFPDTCFSEGEVQIIKKIAG